MAEILGDPKTDAVEQSPEDSILVLKTSDFKERYLEIIDSVAAGGVVVLRTLGEPRAVIEQIATHVAKVISYEDVRKHPRKYVLAVAKGSEFGLSREKGAAPIAIIHRAEREWERVTKPEDPRIELSRRYYENNRAAVSKTRKERYKDRRAKALRLRGRRRAQILARTHSLGDLDESMLASLARMEFEILQLLLADLDTVEIAEEIGATVDSVRAGKRRLAKKLNLPTELDRDLILSELKLE